MPTSNTLSADGLVRKGIRPRFRLSIDLPGSTAFRRSYPFRKHWVAIGILTAFDIVFLIPAVTTWRQASAGWAGFEDLFDLVGALFMSAWLLGWSIAPLLMTTLLLVMLFGREIVTARPGTLRIHFGLPVIGIAADYDVHRMRNLRHEEPAPKSGKSWRGPHLVFDYGANAIGFGSNVSRQDLSAIEHEIQLASGSSVRRGEATVAELEERWESEPEAEEATAEPEQQEAVGPPLGWTSPSTLALIVANLVPVAGAVFFGWNLGDVMVLYWAESAVIGFYNLCKLIKINRWTGILSGVLFIAHFGAFMAVHFLFIWGIFVKGLADSSGGDLTEVARLFVGLWPALLALFVSHGISFFKNFLGKREYVGRNVSKQMAEPYGRIALMHVVLIFGGGLTIIFGEPTPVLLVVIAGKIWFDVVAHIKQRGDV